MSHHDNTAAWALLAIAWLLGIADTAHRIAEAL